MQNTINQNGNLYKFDHRIVNQMIIFLFYRYTFTFEKNRFKDMSMVGQSKFYRHIMYVYTKYFSFGERLNVTSSFNNYLCMTLICVEYI